MLWMMMMDDNNNDDDIDMDDDDDMYDNDVCALSDGYPAQNVYRYTFHLSPLRLRF